MTVLVLLLLSITLLEYLSHHRKFKAFRQYYYPPKIDNSEKKQSWFFWKGRLLVPLGQCILFWKPGSSPFQTNFQIFGYVRQLRENRRQSGGPGNRSTEKTVITFHWRGILLMWKYILKGDMKPVIFCLNDVMGTRSFPGQKNQDCVRHTVRLNPPYWKLKPVGYVSDPVGVKCEITTVTNPVGWI